MHTCVLKCGRAGTLSLTGTHTCVRARTRAQTQTQTQSHSHTHTHTHTHTHRHTHTQERCDICAQPLLKSIYVHMLTYILHTQAYTHIYIHAFIYTYIQTDGLADRPTNSRRLTYKEGDMYADQTEKRTDCCKVKQHRHSKLLKVDNIFKEIHLVSQCISSALCILNCLCIPPCLCMLHYT